MYTNLRVLIHIGVRLPHGLVVSSSTNLLHLLYAYLVGVGRILSEVPVANQPNGTRCSLNVSFTWFTSSHSKPPWKYVIWLNKINFFKISCLLKFHTNAIWTEVALTERVMCARCCLTFRQVNCCFYNGNRTEWSPIRSVIIRVINNIGRPSRNPTELDDTKSCYQLIKTMKKTWERN